MDNGIDLKEVELILLEKYNLRFDTSSKIYRSPFIIYNIDR